MAINTSSMPFVAKRFGFGERIWIKYNENIAKQKYITVYLAILIGIYAQCLQKSPVCQKPSGHNGLIHRSISNIAALPIKASNGSKSISKDHFATLIKRVFITKTFIKAEHG